MMLKYIDKKALTFGAGAIIGTLVFNMVVRPKLPTSLGGGA